MKISENGKTLIKKFEGCVLKAYKPIAEEKYYTIGYGHYGADVKEGQTITKAEADALFDKDIVKYEKAVNDNVEFALNQNQFDALCSIAYNCGAGAIKKLVKGRNAKEVGEAIPLFYVNGANGKRLAGLVNRRKEEQALYNRKERITMQGHVQTFGWSEWKNEGETVGTVGLSKRLEAIRFDGTLKLRARAHVQKYGWLAEVGNGHICGTVGRSLRLEALTISCDTARIRYRVHIGGGVGWTDWKTNGQVCGTVGESKRIEAVEVEVIE